MDSIQAELDSDEFLDALGHTHRRRVLHSLLEQDSMDERSVVDERATSSHEEQLQYVGVRHTHLPKLEDHGLIDWDRECEEISRGPNFRTVRPVLEQLAAHRDELPDDWL